MAVTNTLQLPPSQPDMSRLNTFSGHTVTVTKHLGPKNTVGTMVVPTQPMALKQILDLQSNIPLQHGPGFYHFTVNDTGGNGDVAWMIKLGPDLSQEALMAGGPVNGASPGGFSGSPQPLGEGVIHLGHGFFYNEAMGTLTTPWRAIVSWKQGDPMPVAPTSAAATPAFAPQSTPWGQPQMGGWGGYAVSDDSAKLKALETQLAEERQRRREDDMRAEQARRDAEVRQMVADSNTRFEKLIEKIATKPSGPDPIVEEMRHKNEVLERQLADDRRERENERRFEQQREESRRDRENTERMIRDMNANKSDPMLPMLMQMMQQMNSGAMEAIKAIQSATATANTSAERQTSSLVEQLRSTIMSPMQMIQLMQTSEGKGADMAKMMIESMKETSKMQHEVYGQLLDVASQGGQPAWVQAIDSIASKVGPIGEALANRSQQPKVVVQRVAVPVDPATGRPIHVTPAPAPAPTPIAGAPGVAPAPASTAPTEIRNTPPAEAAAPGTEKPKKRRGKKDKNASPIPAGKGPSGALTVEQIREIDPDVLNTEMAKFADNVFFGDQLGMYVAQIRQRVAAGALTPQELSNLLFDQRNALVAIDPMPMAVELLLAEQIEVLMERMIPEATNEYGSKVVELIRARLEAEAAGADEAE